MRTGNPELALLAAALLAQPVEIEVPENPAQPGPPAGPWAPRLENRDVKVLDQIVHRGRIGSEPAGQPAEFGIEFDQFPQVVRGGQGAGSMVESPGRTSTIRRNERRPTTIP